MLAVTSLVRYPVKSIGGEALTEAWIGAKGIAGDRQWGIRDLSSGTVLTGRRTPALLLATARVEGPEATEPFDGAASTVVITLPDGTETNENHILSSWLGIDVALEASSTDEGGTFENPLTVGGVSEDASEDTDWISWTGPAGSLHDSARTMVSLASEGTIGNWDTRRFRKNILTDGSGEDEFVGHGLQIGAVETQVTKRIDRCVMVTRPLPGTESDLDVLKTINAQRESCLGIGLLITRPGMVTIGDTVTRGSATTP